MPCDVHLVGGAKLTLADNADLVVVKLGHGQLERFEQPGKRPAVWINPANVLLVEEQAEKPAAVGRHRRPA